ncbi:DNA phosphorothioation-dependent restriction protein DptH [Oceanirhabdus seepicola]|uniref:DNA phosphorothioation-dependent restriction protein DptH n=1 Tax=Oceanirhabdus seepicola TaxID=2828781 RepID=A0A9J6NY56_9CLOT|nr:DNA phosphorothioation-dependent restriction protein DptH [Oceanirhabdus seepicola]MCM1988833.1 DNA phosphorothioation-dependent restriction protein DptH [Oceanirhabdus seepicola]
MLNQFYNYLAKKVVKYFNDVEVKNGDKFEIQFEKEDEVKVLYEELKKVSEAQEFKYKAAENASEYVTYSIVVNGIKVIISATINNIKPDYLTRLRNEVGGTNSDLFKNTAILFIHNTTLDSIVGGARSFNKEGMPFHTSSITEDIKEKIENSDLSIGDKYIIEFDLKKRSEQISEDSTSVLQYSDLLTVINKGDINKDEFKNFGIFYDSKLDEINNKKEAFNRLEDNADNYARVDNIHKYGGDIDTLLEKFLDENGVEKLKKVEWEEVEYKEIKQSIESKKKDKKIEYVESKLISLDAENFWEKEEGNTAAKKRKKNIIIFNKDREQKISLELKFDDRVSQRFITLAKNQEATAKASGKKLIVEIDHVPGNVSFNSIKYKDKVTFEFKILVLDIDRSVFDNSVIKTNYNLVVKPKEKYLMLNTERREFEFNLEKDFIENKIISENQSEIIIDSLDSKIRVINEVEQDENTDLIKFNLNILDLGIPLAIKDEGNRATVITGFNVWTKKREEKESFKYDNGKLIQGTRVYFTRDEFRENLEREQIIINSDYCSFIERDGELIGEDIEINNNFKTAYFQLLEYYRVNNLIPSLAYYNEELIVLSKNYVEAFLGAANELKEGEYAKKHHKNLLRVGVIKREDGDKEMLFYPLNPINVMYQIRLTETIENEKINEQLAKKLDSIYLLPYICGEDKKLYKPIEQQHSLEWKYYIKNDILRYKGSREFVSKLVKEKIDEFIYHFNYLFNLTSEAAVKINLINTGDCREILQGIINYYIDKLKKTKPDNLLPIDVNIYSNEISNVFEELSYYSTSEEIEHNLKIDLSNRALSKDYTKEDILNICIQKIHFYKKDIEDEKYEYSHVTFYEMEQSVEEKDSNMNDIITGISLDGLISGVPSKFLGNSYRTGFGNRYMKKGESNILLKLVNKMNALVKVAQTDSPFSEEECRTTAISDESRDKLEKIYDSTHWVTFIDPKVDLNFFKNSNTSRDLLIIHYSDQYTSSSGYDAITVTRKSKQYQVIIDEFLQEKNIEVNDKTSVNVINCFNAVNGDWLLRLISSNGQFPREKLSIISAIKLSLSYFYHKDIVWLPISLEEILRVSKGAGLSSVEGLFSVSNLKGEGQYSDDLLLIGIEKIDDDINVHYYPVEVKIGENRPNVIKKAKKQAYKTRNYLEKHLIDLQDEEENRRFSKKMYRNFMMQLAVVSAEKLKLYELWPEQNWDMIIDSEVRTKLLNDDYTISTELDQYIGRGSIMSFKQGIAFDDEAQLIEINQAELEEAYNEEEFNKGNEILEITFSEDAGYRNIASELESLKEKFVENQSDFKVENLLFSKYKRLNKEDETGSVEGNEEKPTTNISEDKTGYQGGTTTKVKKDEAAISEVDEPKEPMKVLFGHDVKHDREINWYPTDTSKTFHTNTGIIGTMGTGKTQFTKSLIYQLHKNDIYNVDGKKLGLLIFDYKGDYIDDQFVNATDAKVYDIFHLPFNPLALVKGKKIKPLLPLHTANTLKETIANAFNLGVKQQTLLRDVIMEAYERRGIHKAKVPTWDKTPPTLDDVCRIYMDREKVQEDSLYAALKNLSEFEIFEPDPTNTMSLFECIDGVTVINLSGYDEGIQNLVVAITLDIFYTQMLVIGESKTEGQYRQLTNLILVDEADNFLRKNFDSLRKILKEGRMFGVGTILSTQLLSHFSTGDNEYASYILSWIVHNVADLSNKDVRFIFNTKAKQEEEVIYNKIKSLEKHHSLVKFGNEDKPIYVKDKAFWELMK